MSASLYNDIGKEYNLTRKADPYLAKRIYKLLSAEEGNTYLDIGCGTGNYTIYLFGKGLNFHGVEPSEAMLQIARLRGESIVWLNATAENIPAAHALFNGAIATLTIHHWADIDKAFTEINRVLKPGAKLVIFTAAPHQMRDYWLNHYFPLMMERSIRQMPATEGVTTALTAAGFEINGTEKYFIATDLEDNFLYAGKHDPERYFNEMIRNGISSFAALANREEVNAGLVHLREDIDNNNFEKVKAIYDNDEGDYLFIIAKKPIV
jgi:ubiquinone/menaquinone biosynthesis C-methylase UbiE